MHRRSIYKSQTFPTTGYGYVYNLKPELAAKVKEAFFTFHWEGTELLKEFEKSEPPQEKFLPITFKDALGGGARDRQGHERQLRLQVIAACRVRRTVLAGACMLVIEDLTKRYATGDLAVDRRQPRGAGRPGGRPDRPLGRRQVDADPLRQPAGRADRGPDLARRHAS